MNTIECVYSSNNPKISKLENVIGNLSPINSNMDGQFISSRGRSHQSRSPSFDSYTSENLDSIDSTLIRYLRCGSSSSSAGDGFTTPGIDAVRSRPVLESKYSNSKNSSFGSRASLSVSPLSAVENLNRSSPTCSPVFGTPTKVEEDVIVMDGIMVGSVPGGRMRLLSESSGSSWPSSLSANSFYKTQMCRAWEVTGTCIYASKCQFAHGKEDLCPNPFPCKKKADVQCKSYGAAGFCAYGTNCKSTHQITQATPAAEVAATASRTNSSIKPEQTIRGSTISIIGCNWSPQDDGIEIFLPSSTEKPPSRDEVIAKLEAVLYGPNQRRKRLPAFSTFCPDEKHPTSQLNLLSEHDSYRPDQDKIFLHSPIS